MGSGSILDRTMTSRSMLAIWHQDDGERTKRLAEWLMEVIRSLAKGPFTGCFRQSSMLHNGALHDTNVRSDRTDERHTDEIVHYQVVCIHRRAHTTPWKRQIAVDPTTTASPLDCRQTPSWKSTQSTMQCGPVKFGGGTRRFARKFRDFSDDRCPMKTRLFEYHKKYKLCVYV